MSIQVNATLTVMFSLKLINCAQDFTEKYAEDEFMLAYYDNDTISHILHATEKSFTVLNYRTTNTSDIKFHFGLILIEGIVDLVKFLSTVAIKLNQRSKYVLVYNATGDENLILRLCWEHYIWHVVIINKDLEISSYPHFKLENCKRAVSKVNLGHCPIIPNDLFYYEPVFDYKNCSVRTIVLENVPPFVINSSDPINPGYEVLMIKEISKRLNFTVDFVKHNYKNWGLKLLNGSFTLMYKMLYDADVELLMGMVIANETFINVFEYSNVHMSADLVFFVPAANPLEHWKNMVYVFSPTLWFTIFGTMLCTILFWWIIAKNTISEGYNSLAYCCLNVISIYLFVSITQPRTGYMRNMFIIWTWFSLIANSVYQGLLYSYITNPLYEHQISTIEELVESKLSYGGFPTAKFAFNDDKSPTYRKLLANWQYCSLAVDCMNRTANKRDFATIKNVRLIGYYIPRWYTNKDGSPQVFATDPVSMYSFWLMTSMGFPLIEGINALILEMHAGGIINKYYLDTQDFHIREEATYNEPLTIDHMQSAFFILVFGWIIGAVGFLFELLFIDKINTFTTRFK